MLRWDLVHGDAFLANGFLRVFSTLTQFDQDLKNRVFRGSLHHHGVLQLRLVGCLLNLGQSTFFELPVFLRSRLQFLRRVSSREVEVQNVVQASVGAQDLVVGFRGLVAGVAGRFAPEIQRGLLLNVEGTDRLSSGAG